MWVAITFFTFLIAVSQINSYRSVLKREAVAREPTEGNFDIETSFYKRDATWHDVIFFHASASGLAAVLLILIIKGKMLFPGTVIFFGIVSPVAIFMISITLLLLAFYFYAISILKLGDTLGKLQVDGEEIKTMYAIAGVFGHFLFFTIFALILV